MKRHLKRLAAPATWNVKRKSTKFIARALPSGHPMNMCVPLGVFMTEIGSYAKTTKEVKTIIHEKNILVNGRRKHDHRSAVGFLDVVEMGDAQETLRVIIDRKGKIAYVKVPVKEANSKVCKIIGKTALRGNKLQLNLNDGQNFLIAAKDKYNVGDSVVVDIKNNKITEHLPMEKNATVFLVEGKQIGHIGKVADLDQENITITLESGAEYKTRKGCALVVGKDHPAVTVQEQEAHK